MKSVPKRLSTRCPSTESRTKTSSPNKASKAEMHDEAKGKGAAREPHGQPDTRSGTQTKSPRRIGSAALGLLLIGSSAASDLLLASLIK